MTLAFDAATGRGADGDIRYLIIRADGLMQTFAQLPEVHRFPALQALATSVRRHGADSLRYYQRQESLDSAALLELVARIAGTLGWGRWTFDAKTDGSLALLVKDSPFAVGYGGCHTPVCYPILGMFGAVAEIVVGAPGVVEETQCSATGADLCRFSLVR